jgi:hypothetical protein
MLVLAGCAPTPLTDIADPENQEVAINQGGNLHYQNLVLPISNCIVFNSADGKIVSGGSGWFKCDGFK